MNKKPIVIIGAGLSGLACALHLRQHQQKCLVIEQSNSVGGRVKTDISADGFRMDIGFQVLLNSYPELKNIGDLSPLNLKKFHSGAMIYCEQDSKIVRHLIANPLIHPKKIVSGLFAEFPHLSDKALVLSLIAKAHSRYEVPRGQSTLQFLTEFGFGHEFIQTFWKPFLSGVFLDPSLSVSADYFLFLIRCFSSGSVTVPAKGMQELPNMLADKIGHEHFRFNCQVKEIHSNKVILANDEIIEADQVVCAFNDQSSVKNSSSGQKQYFGVSTIYFSAEHLPDWDKWLVLVSPNLKMKINHLAIMSEVSSDYSSHGKKLLAVSVVGEQNFTIDEITKELNQLVGDSLELKHLNTYFIPQALPVISSHKQTEGFLHRNGIFYCGDYLATASINGALQSGRMVAEEIVSSSVRSSIAN